MAGQLCQRAQEFQCLRFEPDGDVRGVQCFGGQPGGRRGVPLRARRQGVREIDQHRGVRGGSRRQQGSGLLKPVHRRPGVGRVVECRVTGEEEAGQTVQRPGPPGVVPDPCQRRTRLSHGVVQGRGIAVLQKRRVHGGGVRHRLLRREDQLARQTQVRRRPREAVAVQQGVGERRGHRVEVRMALAERGDGAMQGADGVVEIGRSAGQLVAGQQRETQDGQPHRGARVAALVVPVEDSRHHGVFDRAVEIRTQLGTGEALEERPRQIPVGRLRVTGHGPDRALQQRHRLVEPLRCSGARVLDQEPEAPPGGKRLVPFVPGRRAAGQGPVAGEQHRRHRPRQHGIAVGRQRRPRPPRSVVGRRDPVHRIPQHRRPRRRKREGHRRMLFEQGRQRRRPRVQAEIQGGRQRGDRVRPCLLRAAGAGVRGEGGPRTAQRQSRPPRVGLLAPG